MLTATAALDPGCELTLLDGKYVELASWVGCAARTVGPNQDECIDVLRVLVKEMDDRYLLLVANRQRKIHQGDGWKLQVIVCDELAFYLNTGSRTGDKEAGNLMRDLVSRGRPPASSSWPPPRSRAATPSRPTCAICSPSGGRSAAPPRR